jgi:hypothetical protein
MLLPSVPLSAMMLETLARLVALRARARSMR